ncbi:DUF2726 domain-containing protein [Marinospirillum sp. MEB164]|uniref:DUF2726 domain-containing protein n=1 Tax=Marinospirillum alkalitolerans TaxID=3123374 RepID=A0ABW8PX28_9GAMM
MGWFILAIAVIVAANLISKKSKTEKKEKKEAKYENEKKTKTLRRTKKLETSQEKSEIEIKTGKKASDNFYASLNKNNKDTKENEASEEVKEIGKVGEWLKDGKKVYRGKSHLMTETERKFFHHMQEKFGNDKRIFAQVRVVDLLNVNWSEIRKGSFDEKVAFRQISQWHVDYVVTDQDFKIICAAELDDASHERDDRQKRDWIMNRAFESAGLKLYRFKLKENDARLITEKEESIA